MPVATTTKTPRPLREIYASKLEDYPMQNFILEYFFANQGKRLDARFVKKMEEAMQAKFNVNYVRLSPNYSQTDLTWSVIKDEFGNSKSESMTIASGVKNLVVDADYVWSNNARNFEAANTRNEQRQQALNDGLVLDELESAIAVFLRAREELKTLLRRPEINVERQAIVEEYGLETLKYNF